MYAYSHLPSIKELRRICRITSRSVAKRASWQREFEKHENRNDNEHEKQQKKTNATEHEDAGLSAHHQNEHPGRRGVENIEKKKQRHRAREAKKKRTPRSMGVPVCQPMSKTSILAVEGLKKSELATPPSMRSKKKSERHAAWECQF